MTADTSRAATERVVGAFNRILEPDSEWTIGSFQLPDGSKWQYREPGAVVLVRNGWLQVSAVPYTRSNDRVQILDNAKHMYFSKETFRVPEGGEVTVELDIRAQKLNGIDNDFYDGFVSLNLLDFSTGIALDFFVSNECYATVYARLPFPGTTVADGAGHKYFGLFKEQPLPKGAQREHHYAITYDQGAAEVRFYVEGALVNRETDVPRMDSFIAALGLMTEKDITEGKSVSCHGQGLVGEWSPLTITTRAVRA